MRKRLVFVLIVMLSVSLLTGCVTLFGKKAQHLLTDNTAPRGADVYVNSFKVGVTPIELNLIEDRFYVIEFRKEGCRTVTCMVNTRIGSGLIILDVLDSLVPVIVDTVRGKWKKLDQEALNAALKKQQ